MDFKERLWYELEKQERFLSRKNHVDQSFYNGIYERYENPALTRDSVPLSWRYDFSEERNPFFMERLGVNAVFNSGALYMDGTFYLVARVEGNDRKSFFAVAESDSPVDGFRFTHPVLPPATALGMALKMSRSLSLSCVVSIMFLNNDKIIKYLFSFFLYTSHHASGHFKIKA